MSEYQYYEFLAIDRPLSKNEMEYMRSLSSRGHITPVSFSNEYHWGDFKGKPKELMRRFYDAHLYVANWGTVVFMLRLPVTALEREVFQPFVENSVFSFEASPTHWICSWTLEESEDYDRFGMEDGTGWMSRLAPLREEIIHGDLRSLYIGWLAAVTIGEIDEDGEEPPMPDGLAPFTAAQEALAEFLEVDDDLLAGAGSDCPIARSTAAESDIDPWIMALPVEDIRQWVRKLLTGRAQEAEREVKIRFASRQKSTGDVPSFQRRTVGELWKRAEAAKEARRHRERKLKEQAEAKRRKEREASLARLAENFPDAWQTVKQRIEIGSGKAYEEACRFLIDLAEAYELSSGRETFDAELRRLMAAHGKRKSLVQRLVKAKLLRGV